MSISCSLYFRIWFINASLSRPLSPLMRSPPSALRPRRIPDLSSSSSRSLTDFIEVFSVPSELKFHNNLQFPRFEISGPQYPPPTHRPPLHYELKHHLR